MPTASSRGPGPATRSPVAMVRALGSAARRRAVRRSTKGGSRQCRRSRLDDARDPLVVAEMAMTASAAQGPFRGLPPWPLGPGPPRRFGAWMPRRRHRGCQGARGHRRPEPVRRLVVEVIGEPEPRAAPPAGAPPRSGGSASPRPVVRSCAPGRRSPRPVPAAQPRGHRDVVPGWRSARISSRAIRRSPTGPDGRRLQPARRRAHLSCRRRRAGVSRQPEFLRQIVQVRREVELRRRTCALAGRAELSRSAGSPISASSAAGQGRRCPPGSTSRPVSPSVISSGIAATSRRPGTAGPWPAPPSARWAARRGRRRRRSWLGRTNRSQRRIGRDHRGLDPGRRATRCGRRSQPAAAWRARASLQILAAADMDKPPMEVRPATPPAPPADRRSPSWPPRPTLETG